MSGDTNYHATVPAKPQTGPSIRLPGGDQPHNAYGKQHRGSIRLPGLHNASRANRRAFLVYGVAAARPPGQQVTLAVKRPSPSFGEPGINRQNKSTKSRNEWTFSVPHGLSPRYSLCRAYRTACSPHVFVSRSDHQKDGK